MNIFLAYSVDEKPQNASKINISTQHITLGKLYDSVFSFLKHKSLMNFKLKRKEEGNIRHLN